MMKISRDKDVVISITLSVLRKKGEGGVNVPTTRQFTYHERIRRMLKIQGDRPNLGHSIVFFQAST